jgi:hypothetical protein
MLYRMASVLRNVLTFQDVTISYWEMNQSAWDEMADQLSKTDFDRYIENIVAQEVFSVKPFEPVDYAYKEGATIYGYPVRLSPQEGWRLHFVSRGQVTYHDGI